ncbi:nucleoside:proton symporter, partial [Gammaproteobacteria bacterium]|nr:nucleoside:proton symporter [Gammaproteobacteria bacterium]
MDLLLVLQALFGIVVFVAIAVVFSEQRTLPGWRLLAAGLGLQFLFAFAVFNLNFLQQMLSLINRGVNAVVNATESGTLFIFGYLGGDPLNVDYPFSISEPGATMILAFRILPLVLMFTVLSAILWHYRVLPVIIKGFSLVLRKSLNLSGAVGFSSAANIFIGMVESPALIRPYIAVLTRSELFVVMSCGMATIAGSVMVFYSIILQGTLDDPLGHIITASVISAPAAIMIALIMVPQKTAATSEEIQLSVEYKSLMDAITKGTYDGV